MISVTLPMGSETPECPTRDAHPVAAIWFWCHREKRAGRESMGDPELPSSTTIHTSLVRAAPRPTNGDLFAFWKC